MIALVDNVQTADRLAYRLETASQTTGISVSKLRKDIADDRLKAIKKGACVVILAEDLLAYLRKSE